VVASSDGTATASAQLIETAALAASQQVDLQVGAPSALTQLARLALPSGLGDQAPLIGEGFDAVAISSAGERPLDSADDQVDDVSRESIDRFGRAVQSTVGALDFATTSPIHGPRTYIKLGSNLVPGWALTALALALIFPAAVIAAELCIRAVRGRERELGSAVVWAVAHSLPFIGVVALLYALTLVGLVPNPPFPFDPGLYGLGLRGAATFVLMALVAGASVFALRARHITVASAPDGALAAAGALAVVACLVIWLANPYLALLVAPAAHVWVIASRATPIARVATAVAAVIALLPLIAALGAVARALDLGASAPWTFTIMVADGQIGLLVIVAGCLLAGSLAASVALAMRRRGPATGVASAE
jgi:hypothetical protein